MILVDYFRQRYMKLSVTWEGKTKTFAQGIAFYLLIRQLADSWQGMVHIIIVVAVTLTVTSGIDYAMRARDLLRPIPEDDIVD